eukprot:344918-Pleurochrysis_carterae.AAC.1
MRTWRACSEIHFYSCQRGAGNVAAKSREPPLSTYDAHWPSGGVEDIGGVDVAPTLGLPPGFELPFRAGDRNALAGYHI